MSTARSGRRGEADRIPVLRALAAQPRVSVSRSVLPIVSDQDRAYFRGERASEDQVGILEGVRARFGKSYVGEPGRLAEELAKDAAVREADTLLITVPNMLGVDYNARLLENVVRHVAPAVGWVPRTPEPLPDLALGAFPAPSESLSAARPGGNLPKREQRSAVSCLRGPG